ncbi:endonuclease/exonuclease/phosphatase family protein [Aspergillus ruber CBS 135680]|uniref:Uncharacterized protein n=1 Tax=Aspergillus ruber (strain CBS 135680) TaxID=1388766 RepID=A0A017SJR0_ASPRC|nr:uncharacterized protein EURHEDRAFT_401314 [Aspergillus ruber CBS 135680]EYE96904.1 hypothetical protein EURHEDRAFT_401314 [Aspergillus ruber CBS 135680]
MHYEWNLFVWAEQDSSGLRYYVILHLCNAYLESMHYTARRRAQLELASTYMHGPGRIPPLPDPTITTTTNLPTSHAAILAGDFSDFNANSPQKLLFPRAEQPTRRLPRPRRPRRY